MRVLRTCLLGLALFWAPLLLAQESNVIEGYVRTSNNQPAPGVAVVLTNSNGLQVDRVTTNDEGHYIFFSLGAGTFTVSVETKGLSSRDSRMVVFSQDETNGHHRIDFTLDAAASFSGGPVSNEPVFAQQVPPEAEKIYLEAMEQLKAGKKDQALGQLQRALEIFPDYYLALRQLAMEALLRVDVAATAKWSQRALAVNRNSSSAHFGLGWAHYQNEKLEPASQELKEAARLNPGVAEIHWFLGMTALELGHWIEAETALKAFLKLHPQNDRPAVYLYLTSAYDHMGRYGDAVDALETYLKSVPGENRTPKLRSTLEQLKRKSKSPH